MSKLNIAPFSATNTKSREISWFAQLVRRGREEGPFTEVVTITPAIAERLLELNDCNRRTNEAQIASIAKDIANGYWQLNGETIIVSREGYLNDGQNRLHAVIRAGEPIRTAMMFGVSRESRFSVDMGRQRRASDFLHMHEIKNSTNTAAIVGLHHQYLHGLYRKNGSSALTLTKQELLHEYQVRADAYNAASELACSERSLRDFGASAVGAAYVILSELNSSECEVFFARLSDGVGLPRGSAILAVRNKLSNPHQRLRGPEKLELILRGWNAWREGRRNDKAPPIVGKYPKVVR